MTDMRVRLEGAGLGRSARFAVPRIRSEDTPQYSMRVFFHLVSPRPVLVTETGDVFVPRLTCRLAA